MSQVAVEYRELVGFPGYRVGSDGSLWTNLVRSGYGKWRSGSEWRRKATSVCNSGYAFASLYVNGKRCNLLIHRLVLEAFVSPCPDGMEACHADGDRLNNTLKNLRWGTCVENCSDRARHGNTCSGEKNAQAIVTEAEVVEIRTLLQQGVCQTEIAKKYRVHKTTISLIAARKTWKHV